MDSWLNGLLRDKAKGQEVDPREHVFEGFILSLTPLSPSLLSASTR